MKQVQLLNHDELVYRISILTIEKNEKEIALKTSIKEIIDSFDQLTIMKTYIREIAGNTEIKSNLARIGINIGVKFLLKKFFSSEKNKMESPFLQFSRSFIIDQTPNLILGIQNLVQKRDRIEKPNIEVNSNTDNSDN